MRKNILLVEGPNDKSVILGLLQKNDVIISDFEIVVCGGIDNLPPQLELYLKNGTAYKMIGVVVDADISAEARWQQLKDRLMKTGKYDCKKMPLNSEGMIVAPQESEDAKVGIWIMPDNQYQGALEDFLLKMIPQDDEILEEVERELAHLEAERIKRYKDKDRNKAMIYTYLSWEKNPGCSLNTAIVSYVLNPKTALADTFVKWIKGLFLCEEEQY